MDLPEKMKAALNLRQYELNRLEGVLRALIKKDVYCFLIIVIFNNILVRAERLELSHLSALEPKSSASTNSATLATKKKYYNLY